MSLTLSVLLPNGRRKNTKVLPNTVISQTLEEVCKKEKYDLSNYSFLFQRKILEESLSWRYANVPNNAKLELVPQEKDIQESPVRIALQYDGGQRLQSSFLPAVTLIEILEHWKSELSTLNPSQDHEPSILYLRQEITGKLKLSNTSLKSLGLTNGSAILRLSFKPMTHDLEVNDKKKHVIETSPTRTELPRVQKIAPPKKITPQSSSVEKIRPPKKSVPPSSGNDGAIKQKMLPKALEQVPKSGMDDIVEETMLFGSESIETMDVSSATSSTDFIDAMEDTSVGNSSKQDRVRSRRPNSNETRPIKKIKQISSSPEQDFSNFKFPEESKGMDVYTPEHEPEINIEPLMQSCEREAIFFDEKELENFTDETGDPGDEFFELTMDDMKRMISELRSLQTEADETPLMTARSRELQRFRSINQYPKIVVRVIFPNRKVLQGIFRPAENVQTIYDFVNNFLGENIDFYLYTTPPKIILKDKKSILYDYQLAPASKVYFGLKNQDFDENVLSGCCESFKGSVYEANLKLKDVFELKEPGEQPTYDSNTEAVQSQSSRPASSETPSTSRQNSSNRPTSSKVPKWFKMGK